jgi:hypothetical protein
MDVQTAATLADLRQQLDAARRDNERLNSEVSAIGTRSSMDREEIDALTTLLASARKDSEFLRGFANNPDVERLRDERDAARQALNDTDMELAKAMSRAEVLEAELTKWRAWCDAEDSVLISEPLLWQDVVNARANTDRTNALDPAKFEGKP